MGASPLRYKRLIRELPNHKHAKDALLASGFTESTANTQAKSVLRSALKHEARDILKGNSTSLTSKQMMSEILGLTREQLFERLRYIATQEKDLGSALKVLAPLSKEHGVVLSADDEAKTVNAPVLNLSFGMPQNMAKNIEPVIEHVTIDSQELKDGSTKP